jgi:hypothetical protein
VASPVAAQVATRAASGADAGDAAAPVEG